MWLIWWYVLWILINEHYIVTAHSSCRHSSIIRCGSRIFVRVRGKRDFVGIAQQIHVGDENLAHKIIHTLDPHPCSGSGWGHDPPCPTPFLASTNNHKTDNFWMRWLVFHSSWPPLLEISGSATDDNQRYLLLVGLQIWLLFSSFFFCEKLNFIQKSCLFGQIFCHKFSTGSNEKVLFNKNS